MNPNLALLTGTAGLVALSYSPHFTAGLFVGLLFLTLITCLAMIGRKNR